MVVGMFDKDDIAIDFAANSWLGSFKIFPGAVLKWPDQ
jgi:hypothetical protein